MTLVRLTRFGFNHEFKEPVWLYWDGSMEEPYMVCDVEVDRLNDLGGPDTQDIYISETDGDVFTLHEDEPDEYHIAVARQALLGTNDADA